MCFFRWTVHDARITPLDEDNNRKVKPRQIQKTLSTAGLRLNRNAYTAGVKGGCHPERSLDAKQLRFSTSLGNCYRGGAFN